MTWIAPTIDRPDPPWVGEEEQMLDGWLDFHRQTLLAKCAGLDAKQLKVRAAEPSNLSLLGLVRHMAEVERVWFRVRVGGEALGRIFCTTEEPDLDFDGIDAADAEADFRVFAEEIEAARAACKGRSLNESYESRRTNGQVITFNLRGVLVHMIEEYARHNGHADLLRERIDGTVET
jgi:uncharacterized damage-inducible protein DinB